MFYQKIDETQYITINFTYNDQLITLQTSPYKKLNEVKNKAIKKLSIINNGSYFTNIELHCFYLGRDLIDYENEVLATLFKNREKVSLKLMQPKKHISILSNITSKNVQNYSKNTINTSDLNSNTPSPKSQKYYFSTIVKNNNIYSSGFNNIGVINMQKGTYLGELIRANLKKKNILSTIDDNSSFQNKSVTDKRKRTILTEINSNDLSSNSSSIKNRKYFLNSSNNFKCLKCCKNKMVCYCRTCNEFICNECKNSFNHQNHLMINLDMENLSSNINVYGNIIQTDIQENIENNNNLINKENIIEDLDEDFLEQKNAEIIKKLEDLVKIYLNIIEILKNAMKKETKNKINESILGYNNDASKINQNINKVLDNLDKNNNNKPRMLFTDLKNNFNLINSKEIELNELNKKISKYYICSEINNKISNVYDKINDILSEVVDIKKLFSLDSKYYNALFKIINDDKSIDNSENDSTNNSNTNLKTNENCININTDINDNNINNTNTNNTNNTNNTINTNNTNNKLNNKNVNNKTISSDNSEKDNYINGENKSSTKEDEFNKSEIIKKRKKSKIGNRDKKRHKTTVKGKKIK